MLRCLENHFLCLLILTVTLERKQVFKSDWSQVFALLLTNCGYLEESGQPSDPQLRPVYNGDCSAYFI